MARKPAMILFWQHKILTLCQQLLLLCLALIVLPARSYALTAAPANDDSERFAALQAAYVFNIAKFFKWPSAELSNNFVLCLFGDSKQTLFQQLQKGTENRVLHQLPVKVVHLNGSALESSANACHMLYLAEPPTSAQWQVLLQHYGETVLKIAAPDVKSEQNAVIELALEQNRLVLYLNAAALARSELQANPSFLSVAKQR